ncbi:MAG: sigma-70 family RNA polymerase sigma factor [Hyphomicrobiales bacterium]|uniref:sigma-70 family RNA polymerase sigma factor n=1 Tax=Nisaea sp. TaxID=2024842 RepID=UPI003277992B
MTSPITPDQQKTARSEVNTLLAKIALNDRNAFNELWERTSAKLFGVCLRILKNRNEAEEALQEVYVKIWRKADSYAPSNYSPMTWLISIARNEAIDRLRAKKPATVDIEEVYDLASDAPTPEKAAIAASDLQQINACMEELQPIHAAAVQGAYLEGYSYQELADTYEIPVNTMRTWLRRSLIKLKECLQR